MSAIPNPYDPLQPTDNPAYFYGRDETFAFFRQNLVDVSHDRALVLSGRRGLGKSSVLRQLGYQLDDRYRPAILRLEGLDYRDETALLAALVDEIHLTMERAEVSTYRLPTWPVPEADAEPVDLRQWFQHDFMDVAMTALHHRYLLLVFDDAHLLLDAIAQGDLPADLPDYLQAVLRAYDQLALVLAVDDAYEADVLAIDLSSDPTLHFRLTEMSPAESERLIRDPMQGIASYEPSVVARILALADGHPFLVHSVCRLLFRRSEERGHHGSITDHDLTAVYPAALEQADEIFSPLWNRASHNERITLAAMVAHHEHMPGADVAFDQIYDWLVRSEYDLNKTQLASALRSLDYTGFIRTRPDGRYAFPAEMIPAWIGANSSAPTVMPGTALAGGSRGRWLAALGVLLVIVVVGGLGAAVWGGVFDSEDDDQPLDLDRPTATLSVKIEETRQMEAATQTEAARPTDTPTRTSTPTETQTPTETPTPTRTSTPTRTPRPTTTDTATPTRTPSRTPTEELETEEPEPTDAPDDTATPRPTRTRRPSATPSPTDQVPPTNTPRATRAATLIPG